MSRYNGGGYRVLESPSYWDCIHALRHDDHHPGALPRVHAELRRMPFHNPRLRTHDVGKTGNADTRPGDAEFTSVGQLAGRLCKEAGHTVKVPENETWKLLSAIYEKRVAAGTPLSDISFGRGWMHHSDVVPLALAHAVRLDAPRYSAVIVEEAQDLTLVELKLLRALVNAPDHDADRANGLLILGDNGQRIYDGAYTLGEIGMEVSGRSIEMKENYRDTVEIIEAA